MRGWWQEVGGRGEERDKSAAALHQQPFNSLEGCICRVTGIRIPSVGQIRFFKLHSFLSCPPPSHLIWSLAIMNPSSAQAARIPFSQAKVPTARQIRKAEKLEKRASMHGSRHPGRLDGAIGRLTQVRSCVLPPLRNLPCISRAPRVSLGFTSFPLIFSPACTFTCTCMQLISTRRFPPLACTLASSLFATRRTPPRPPATACDSRARRYKDEEVALKAAKEAALDRMQTSMDR